MTRNPARWAVLPILVALMVTGVAFAKSTPGGSKRRAAKPRATAIAPPAPLATGSAGMIVVIDPETGRIGPASPTQMAQLFGSQSMWLNHSTEGLVQRRMPDGSTMVDLQGRFREYYLVRIGPTGSLQPTCVEEPDAILRTLMAPPAPVAEDR
jgi:hypothetical protein